MIVLGIDTSAANSSAAVLGDGVRSVAGSSQPRAHGQVLPGLINAALAEAGVDRSSITHIAVARGPGLFTGMRVGLVTAQMLGLALDRPVAGVSTLAAVARRVADLHQPAGGYTVLLDARRREAFEQRFEPGALPASEPRTLALADAESTAGPVWVDPAAAALGFPGQPLEVAELAAEVAAVALARWQQSAEQEPPTPLYLRRPDTSRANPARSVLGQR